MCVYVKKGNLCHSLKVLSQEKKAQANREANQEPEGIASNTSYFYLFCQDQNSIKTRNGKSIMLGGFRGHRTRAFLQLSRIDLKP
jgi:hypothetical protein